VLVTMLSASAAGTDTGTITVEAGQTVEIGTDTAAQKPQFSWILTKDRQFQGAQRTPLFQMRPTIVGSYVLDVSVQDPVASQNDYRAFNISVTDPSGLPLPPPPDQSVLKAILQTEPVSIGNTVYLPPQGGLIALDPAASSGIVSAYKLDLNTAVDSDGNGNPSDDNDTQGSLFERSGNRIWFYMLPGSSARSIALTVEDASHGTKDTLILNVTFAVAPVNTGTPPPTQTQNGPLQAEVTDLTARFHAALGTDVTQGKELLSQWKFGDGARSLLDSPIHTYAAGGTYTVALTVRNIANGEIVFTGTSTLSVSGPAVPVPASSSSSSSASSNGGTKTSFGIGAFLKVAMIIILLLAFAIGLYALLTWLKRRTTGSLQQTLERVEQTIVKQDPKTAVREGTVEPMKLKKTVTTEKVLEDVSDREQAKTEFKSKERDNVTPIADSGPVPDWLKKATPTPAPAPAPQKPAPKPAPAPAQPKPATPAPVAPKPAPAPQPKPQPAPAPTAAPVAPPKPAPAPAPAPVKPAPTPAPKPLADAVAPKVEPTPAPVKSVAPAPAPQPAPKPVTPAPAAEPKPVTPAPVAEVKPASEEPIVFIQADSISKNTEPPVK
jgi:hypothetical protein